jgi:putative peptide zinc metalloprotease protein
MRRPLHRLLGPALIVALMLGLTSPAWAQDPHDNSAVAFNTKDGSKVFRLAFSLLRLRGDADVNVRNTALAYAHCDGCQAVAIAFEVVLVMGDPVEVSARNTAIAINDRCSGCQTLAAAHQFIVITQGRVRLTSEGRHQVAILRHELRELRHTRLSIQQLQARIDHLAAVLDRILATELKEVRRHLE